MRCRVRTRESLLSGSYPHTFPVAYLTNVTGLDQETIELKFRELVEAGYLRVEPLGYKFRFRVWLARRTLEAIDTDDRTS